MDNGERAFRLLVAEKHGQITTQRNIGLKLFNLVMRHSTSDCYVFADLAWHDVEMLSDNEDMHSAQLKKKICSEYLKIRLLTHREKHYTDVIQQIKVGQRQKLTKLILFQNV